MHPDAINYVSPVSSFVPIPFSVPSRFAVLDKVVLGETGNKVVGISQKSRRRARRRLGKSHALRISSVSLPVSVSAPAYAPVSVYMPVSVSVPMCASVSVSGDLGSEDPLTLSYVVNEHIPTTCMMDSGASSQFNDLDFALNMNLPLVPKGKPEDLVLADRARSIVGQITHTCNLKLAIDQHIEEVTSQVIKLAR